MFSTITGILSFTAREILGPLEIGSRLKGPLVRAPIPSRVRSITGQKQRPEPVKTEPVVMRLPVDCLKSIDSCDSCLVCRAALWDCQV